MISPTPTVIDEQHGDISKAAVSSFSLSLSSSSSFSTYGNTAPKVTAIAAESVSTSSSQNTAHELISSTATAIIPIPSLIHRRRDGYIRESFGQPLAFLGKGNHGNVTLHRHPWSGAPLAIKKHTLPSTSASTPSISSRALLEHKLQSLEHEASITLSLQHPNVVRTFAYVYEEGSDGLYSVMEAHSHDLFSEILRYPGQIMPADKSMAYFAQIAAALYYLHIDCRVAHRDIKLDNLVLSRDSQTAMLVDFGCARRFTPHIPAIAYSVCGSDPYIAPEILANSNCGGYANGKVVGYDAFKADVWALGIVFLALRSARFPWELAKDSDENYALFRKHPRSVIKYWLNYSSNSRSEPAAAADQHQQVLLTDLLEGMLDTNAGTRLTIDKVIVHPWMQMALRTTHLLV